MEVNEIILGMQVKVRSFEDMVLEFGTNAGIIICDYNIPFVDSMCFLCGREFTVRSLLQKNKWGVYGVSVELEEEPRTWNSAGSYWITPGMLESCEKHAYIYQPDEVISILSRF